MAEKIPISKQIEQLKKDNLEIKKRLKSIETTLSLNSKSQEQVVNENVTEEEKSSTSVAGILLIIFGSLLCLTIIGGIIGLPLLIWGIIIINKKSNESKDKKENIKPIIKEETEKESFESNVGLKWFSRIGILALVIGIGFFIKYAIDNNWINHLTRILLGVVLGVGLIILGKILSKKYEGWAKTLIGGGFALNYFSVYAAYHFEEYRLALGISQSLEIILLSVVVIFAVIMSVKDDSKIIASEAFFLGFVTSLLSRSFEILTLTYGLILSLGILALVYYKKWNYFTLGSIFSTYIIFLSWFFRHENNFVTAILFLSAFFIIHAIQLFLLDKVSPDLNIIATILNSLWSYPLFYVMFQLNHHEYKGLFTFIFALVHFVIYFVSKESQKTKYSLTNIYLMLIYTTLGVIIEFEKIWITIFFIVQTIILIYLTHSNDRKFLRIPSIVSAGILLLKVVFIDSWNLDKFSSTEPFTSTISISFILTALSLYGIIYYLSKKGEAEGVDYELAVYSFSAAALIVILIAIEMKDFWTSIGWGSFAFIIMFLGFFMQRERLRQQGLIVFAITIFKVFLYDTRNLETLYRTISFIVLGILLLVISFIYAKNKEKFKEII